MLHKTRVAIRFRAKKKTHCADYPKCLRWYACGADRRLRGKALDNIDLNLVSHGYVSGVLKDDHFVSACSRAPRFRSIAARIITAIKRSIDLSSLYH